MATIAGLVVEISARSQKFQKAMQGAQKRVDTLRRVTKEHSKRIEKSLRGAFESAASSVRGFAKKAASRLSTFAKQARGIATQIGKWVAAGLTAAAAAVTAVVTTTSLAMRDLIRDSKAVGVAASDLQAWQYAARSMGVEGDKVQDIMKDVNDKVGDFVRTGGGEAADIFEQLGINARDFIGLAPDQALLRISDALDGLSLGEKTFFMESLADDASRLLPLLDDNAKGLRAMGEQGRNWGNIMTQAEIQASAALGNTLTDAKNMAGGFKQLLGANLAPTFSALIGWIEDLAGEFGGPRKAAESMARGIVQAMIDTVEGIQSMIANLKDAYYWYVRIRELEVNAQAALEAGQNFITGGTETPAMDELNQLRKTRADLESGAGLGAGTVSALQDLKDRIGAAGSGISGVGEESKGAAVSVNTFSRALQDASRGVMPTGDQTAAPPLAGGGLMPTGDQASAPPLAGQSTSAFRASTIGIAPMSQEAVRAMQASSPAAFGASGVAASNGSAAPGAGRKSADRRYEVDIKVNGDSAGTVEADEKFAKRLTDALAGAAASV